MGRLTHLDGSQSKPHDHVHTANIKLPIDKYTNIQKYKYEIMNMNLKKQKLPIDKYTNVKWLINKHTGKWEDE